TASSTSAPRLFDDAARPPRLTTGTPQALTARDGIVQMLTVPRRSPRVPTVSTLGRDDRTRSEHARILDANAASPGPASPLICSATPHAAIWASVAPPSMTRAIAQPASAGARSSPEVGVRRTCGHVGPSLNAGELPTSVDLSPVGPAPLERRACGQSCHL